MATAVLCTEVCKSYGDVRALRGLDLEVELGECFGLLGPNGAGKTTTIEILEGLMPADSGTVRVLQQSWGDDDRTLRQRIGVQLQESQLIDKLTVYETVRLFRSFYPRGRDVEEVIDALELREKRDARIGKLSGGQRQRAALATALVSTPELLFLDEPTTGLDPQARLKLWDLVESFRAGGGTVLVTTHYMEEAERLCDRVAIIDHGTVIAVGTPRELINGLNADQILTVRAGADLEVEELAALPGINDANEVSGTYRMSVADIAASLPALLAHLEQRGVILEAMSTHQPTLEDVFVNLTGRGLRDA